MYTSGEALQWYDPALLFPSCPFGSCANGEDEEHGYSNSPSSSFQASPRDSNGSRSATTPGSADYLSPATVTRRVQDRACELLLDRLSGDTLTSDRDACASAAALVQSLHKADPVQLTTATGKRPQQQQHPQDSTSRASNPLVEFTQHATSSFPATLSGSTTHNDLQRRRRRRSNAHASIYVLGDDSLNELFGSDPENAENQENRDSNNYDYNADKYAGGGYGSLYNDYMDDDDLSLGCWSGLQSSSNTCGDGAMTTAVATAHARDLRAYFTSLPTQLGIQEEPVLCPLNLQSDPLAHVVAAAEVFAVVTATVPQVLYVFDQLNNLPISSSVLGGTSYTAAGGSNCGGSGSTGVSLGQSFAGKQQMGFGESARITYKQDGVSPSSPGAAMAIVVSCRIDVSDTVQQLWMDPSGQYCVLVFASGKCVYYHIPRLPSTAGTPAVNGGSDTGGETATAGSSGGGKKSKKGETCDAGKRDADDEDLESKRRRRQERHKEWKAAARRWLRFSHCRRPSCGGNGDGNSEVGKSEDSQDSDAAYRPRGFSLTFVVTRAASWLSDCPPANAAAASTTLPAGVAATNIPPPFRSATTQQSPLRAAGMTTAGFAPSCVGWARHLAAQSQGGPLTSAASGGAAAVSPRSILKTRDLPSATSHAVSKQVTFKTKTTASAVSFPLEGSAAVEAFLGAQHGGCLLACLLTPAGPVDTRVVFQFPAPMAQAAIDSVAAVCAPAVPLYDSDDDGQKTVESERFNPSSNAGGSTQGGPNGMSTSSRDILWGLDVSSPADENRGGNTRNKRGNNSIFPMHAHTSHFLSADEEQRNADDGVPPDPPSSSSTAFTRGAYSLVSPRQRRWWVVLISIKNLLYVFSTPSLTTDFSELDEIREVSLSGGATMAAVTALVDRGAGYARNTASCTPPPLLRSTLKAAAHRLSGRVEDAFLLFTECDDYRSYAAVHENESSSFNNRASLFAAPAASTKPPLPSSSTVSETCNVASVKHTTKTPTTVLMADRLHNFIAIELAALSECSCTAYNASASQVRTAPPDMPTAGANPKVAEATWSDNIPSASRGTDTKSDNGAAASVNTQKKSSAQHGVWTASPAAPFLLESITRGTLHLVLPPSPAKSNSAAQISCHGLVTPAALPPVFYWQYGDVVVQGIILCGAGGLGVGAKVRALVHHGMHASTQAAVSGNGGFSQAYGRNSNNCTATNTINAGCDDVFPVNHDVGTSGIEAGLKAIVNGALRDTQDLNVLVDGAAAAASGSRNKANGEDRLSGRDEGVGRQDNHASLRATSPSSATVAERVFAGHPIGVSASLNETGPRATSSSAVQPAVLPIGILSVTNINSCLQSLRGLLEATSLTRNREPNTARVSRGLTYTRSTVHTTINTLSADASAVNASSSRAGLVGLSRKGKVTDAAALRHSPLQFTTFTSYSPGAENNRKPSSNSGGAGVYKKEPGRKRCTDSPRSPVQLDLSLNAPLLSSALARGDVDGDAVRRLRAAAWAYVCRSPVLFDTPVGIVSQATATASTAAAPTAVLSSPIPDTQTLAARPGTIPSNSSTATRQDTTLPLSDIQRSSTMPGSVDGEESGFRNAPCVGLDSGTSFIDLPGPHTFSAASIADDRKGAGRGQSGGHRFPFFGTTRRAANRARSINAGDTNAARPPLSKTDEGVILRPQGELLVSISASYTHITFSTTQGVYVIAHAAPLPLVEAALSWRHELVYHVVTACASVRDPPPASHSPSPRLPPPTPSRQPLSVPLFTAMADPAAPDVFYLASRKCMIRLQSSSLRSSAAGRKQFVMQLLAKAAAVQRINAPAPQCSHLLPLQRAFTSQDVKKVLHSTESTTLSPDSDSASKGVSATIVAAVRDATSTVETVVVPSSLAYEVRLKGLLREGGNCVSLAEAVRPTKRGQRQQRGADDESDNSAAGDDEFGYGFERGHRCGSTAHASSVCAAGANGSWRSSHLSRASSAKRRYADVSSSGGAPNEAQSTESLQSVGGAVRAGGVEHPIANATAATRALLGVVGACEQHSQSDSGTPLLSRGHTTVAVRRQRSPASGGAQHSPCHPNRCAPLTTVPSATSLLRGDGRDPPLSLFNQALDNVTQDQQQRHPARHTVVVSATGTSEGGLADTPGGAVHTPTLFERRFPHVLCENSSSNNSSFMQYPSFASAGADCAPPTNHSLYKLPLSTLIHPQQGQSTNAFTHYVSPLTHAANGAGETVAVATTAQVDVAKQAAAAAVTAALGTASRSADRDLVSFLGENPLLHFLLKRSASMNTVSRRKSVLAEVGNSRTRKLSDSAAPSTQVSEHTRAINVPGFGVLPGSVGLTPLRHVTSRAVASLLLQTPMGANYYCPDHLYELALAAAACAVHDTLVTPSTTSSGAACRHFVVTRDDVNLIHLVRHGYGGFLLSQQRFLEAAVQYGKAPDGPTPFTAVLIELVRGFRESNSLEPLALFLQLRLRALEDSAQGLGGHGMEVSVLATWLLSLQLEQCSSAREQRRQYEADSIELRNYASNTDSRLKGKNNDRSKTGGASNGDTDAAASVGPTNFTRAAWIRRRYHLDHPTALLEDTLLRYSRFVDWTVISTSLARLASAHEAVLVSELHGSPEKTVTNLVLREQNYFAGLLRLQAMLADPNSQSAQTRHLLQTLIGGEEEEVAATAHIQRSRRGGGSNAEYAASLTAPGTMQLATVFYGITGSSPPSNGGKSDSAAALPLPAPRDTAVPPRTLASLFERLSTLFMCCYPYRFVQDGLLALLNQRQDVPLPPRRLLPALQTYTVANNESVFEATGDPEVVLRALVLAKRVQQQQQQEQHRLQQTAMYAAGAKAGKKEKTKKEKKRGGLKSESRVTGITAEKSSVEPQTVLRYQHEEEMSIRRTKKQHSTNHHGSSERAGGDDADSTALSVHKSSSLFSFSAPTTDRNGLLDPSLPPSSTFSSTTSFHALSPNVSHRGSHASDPTYSSFPDHADPLSGQQRPLLYPLSSSQLEANTDAEYDEITLSDSSSGSGSKSSGVDEDIVLLDVPKGHPTSTRPYLQNDQNSFSSSPLSTTFSGASTPSSSRFERRNSFSSAEEERRSEEDGNEGRTSTPSSSSSDSSFVRNHDDNCTSWTGTREGLQGNDLVAAAGQVSRHKFQQSALADFPNSPAASSTSISSSDVVDHLLATTESTSESLTITVTQNESNISSEADEETGDQNGGDEVGECHDFDYDDLSSLMGISEGCGDGLISGGDGSCGVFSGDGEGKGRLNERIQRARQKRNAAARQLRHTLTPTLTQAIAAAAEARAESQEGVADPSVVKAATTCKTSSRHGTRSNEEGGNDNDSELPPIPQHAVLLYLENIVVHGGAPENSHFDNTDVAVFVAYVNILARDGGEEALQKFTEQLALQYIQKADAWDSSTSPAGVSSHALAAPAVASSSAYCLLHVLHLCASHRRWVGCVWMYYALGYYRDAVEVALRYVVGEEGVHLAVRLLQLLYERDRRRGREARRRDLYHDDNKSCSAFDSDATQWKQEVRRSRRELWMLVARHLIQGGRQAKDGVQKALQLSLRCTGDSFNITDVLPELPDTLCMAGLNEELLGAVRELSLKMRRLRANTNALARDTRVLHRELQLMEQQPLAMQVEERCVLCGQPGLARPFMVYHHCRHLIHTSCYHHARKSMQRRDEEAVLLASTPSSPQPPTPISKLIDASPHSTGHRDLGRGSAGLLPLYRRAGSTGMPGSSWTGGLPRTEDHLARSRTVERVDSMECLLCARRYLRVMLEAPLHVSFIGDDARQSNHRVLLR